MPKASGDYKTCAGCYATKTLDQFSNDRSRVDGLCPYCRTCHGNRVKAAQPSKRQIDERLEKAETIVGWVTGRLPAFLEPDQRAPIAAALLDETGYNPQWLMPERPTHKQETNWSPEPVDIDAIWAQQLRDAGLPVPGEDDNE